MQASDHQKILSRSLQIIIIVSVTFISLCWLYQENLSQYWTLHFHQDAPWDRVSSGYWREGAKIMNAATLSENTFISALHNENTHQGQYKMEQDTSVSGNVLSVLPAEHRSSDMLSLEPLSQEPSGLLQLSRRVTGTHDSNNQSYLLVGIPSSTSPDREGTEGAEGPLYENGTDGVHKAILGSSEKVLLIGDSMMEGVAPGVLKIIREKHHVTGINLSRRSTGLAYPGFYNWPAKTAETLRQTPSIGLLVVFLGPNDPWDMPEG
ncbi:hypothetical protein VU661_25030, partial [Enterobacter kobei]